jgi:hypothetical protein
MKRMARENASGRAALASAIASSGGAILATLAALSCCLPLAPFLLAAGLAGASAVLLSLQPYLIGLAGAMLIFGFVKAFRARQCSRTRRVLNIAVLLCSTGLVAAMLFAQFPARAPAGQPPVGRFNLEAFRQSFNAVADSTRVVALFSPT